MELFRLLLPGLADLSLPLPLLPSPTPASTLPALLPAGPWCLAGEASVVDGTICRAGDCCRARAGAGDTPARPRFGVGEGAAAVAVEVEDLREGVVNSPAAD